VSPKQIASSLRQQIRKRAKNRCEYCLIAEQDTFFTHEIDHIIATKHGGRTSAKNLALACFDCNRFKGSDIASVDRSRGELVALFNPRTQNW
jgi:5-methylcytosine-specific restriction endonuclease McrA